jgi:ribosomal protein S7
MYDGKKSTAESIFYGAMEFVQERGKTTRSRSSARPSTT